MFSFRVFLLIEALLAKSQPTVCQNYLVSVIIIVNVILN